MKYSLAFFSGIFIFLFSCNKKDIVSTPPEIFTVQSFSVNGITSTTYYNTEFSPSIKLTFSAPVLRSAVPGNVLLLMNATNVVPINYSYQNGDSSIVIQPVAPLSSITQYVVSVSRSLLSQKNSTIQAAYIAKIITKIDSSDKFPLLTESQLMDTVQRRTFRYFWEFGHPISGMARERNTSGNLVTTGGTGFGIMAIPVAIKRNFITRSQGLERIIKIVNFYKNNCTAYHGAFAHWIDGGTGATIPFSTNDNGADLVETSFLLEGLLAARQYFNSTINADEIALRANINQLWDAVDWNWFRKNNENVLYWHWSPDKAFAINAQVRGWNEALITYIMAASSRTNAIPRSVYENGWANNGNMRNNNTYYGYSLPLGPPNGGPLFFEHYSFLGINPNGLQDVYANYQTQTINHTKINYEYCKANPRGWYGYSNLCWGLTASDVPGGYNANEPNNDPGVISPTAALSSMPYTPVESMAALKFFYYKLGDKLWGEYGFYDAFKLSDPWFASSTLAIDQGPIIIMIENYRSGFVWDLLTSCPEIKTGMRNLGFTAPYL